jgi:hypothetical protein
MLMPILACINTFGIYNEAVMSLDTNISAYEDIGIYMSASEIAQMTEEDREDMFSDAAIEYDLTPEEMAEIAELASAEIAEFLTLINAQINDCEAIADSDFASTSQIDMANKLIAELTVIADGLENDVEEDFNDVMTFLDTTDNTIASGEEATHNSADIDESYDSVEIVYDASDAESGTGSSFNDENNTMGYDVDTDGDGTFDDFVDADGNDVPDRDFNEDGVIDELDWYGATVQDNATLVVDLEDGDSWELVSYDDTSPATAKYKVTKEDGTEYFITAIGDNLTIVCDTPPTNLSSMPPELKGRSQEFTNSEDTYLYLTEGYELTGEHGYFSIYDMADKTDNNLSTAFTSADIQNGREVTVNFQDSVDDDFTCDLPDDAVVTGAEYSYDPEAGGRILTLIVEDAAGNTMRITLVGFDQNDTINITGGEFSQEAIDALNSYSIWNNQTSEEYILYSDLISSDGEPLSGRDDDEITADIEEFNGRY